MSTQQDSSAAGAARSVGFPPPAARLMTPEEAAVKLSLSPKTLAKDRCTRQLGIPFVKFLRSVRYRESDLDKFIAERVVA